MYYLHMTYINYPAVIHKDEEGVYQVTFPDFPGCFTFGYSYDEAMKKAEEVLQLWIEEMVDVQKLMPTKSSQTIMSNVTVQLA